jgi:hypothetical protein
MVYSLWSIVYGLYSTWLAAGYIHRCVVPDWSPRTCTKNGYLGYPCQPPSAKNKISAVMNFENLRPPSVATLRDRNCRAHWRPRCHPLASHLAMLIDTRTCLIPMHFRQKWLPWLPCQPPPRRKTKSQPLYNFENLRQPSVATLRDRNCRAPWPPLLPPTG